MYHIDERTGGSVTTARYLATPHPIVQPIAVRTSRRHTDYIAGRHVCAIRRVRTETRHRIAAEHWTSVQNDGVAIVGLVQQQQQYGNKPCQLLDAAPWRNSERHACEHVNDTKEHRLCWLDVDGRLISDCDVEALRLRFQTFGQQLIRSQCAMFRLLSYRLAGWLAAADAADADVKPFLELSVRRRVVSLQL